MKIEIKEGIKIGKKGGIVIGREEKNKRIKILKVKLRILKSGDEEIDEEECLKKEMIEKIEEIIIERRDIEVLIGRKKIKERIERMKKERIGKGLKKMIRKRIKRSLSIMIVKEDKEFESERDGNSIINGGKKERKKIGSKNKERKESKGMEKIRREEEIEIDIVIEEIRKNMRGMNEIGRIGEKKLKRERILRRIEEKKKVERKEYGRIGEKNLGIEKREFWKENVKIKEMNVRKVNNGRKGKKRNDGFKRDWIF